MFDILLQVFLAIIGIVFRSAMNIVLCILLSRMFTKWFGLHAFLSFFCANYCLSFIVRFILRRQLLSRLKEKDVDERIFLDQLSWKSSRTANQLEFEIDWNILLDDDRNNILSSIVDIPFHNRWVLLAIIILINYQLNSETSNYIEVVIRTIGLVIILISGSAIRYQTLFERDRQKYRDLSIEKPDRFERLIVYSKETIPIASVYLERIDTSEESVFTVQSYQLNSKFNDYLYDIVNYTCMIVIERMRNYTIENEKSVRLVWPLPMCKKNWTFALKANKFIFNKTYRDFSFMPFVHSYVEQYEYEQLVSKKDQ